uniref:Uncharacterized protein n=1 Tax=Rhodosorus marinus TaxID=101924 RepID=A0A6T6LIR2_9RHOD
MIIQIRGYRLRPKAILFYSVLSIRGLVVPISKNMLYENCLEYAQSASWVLDEGRHARGPMDVRNDRGDGRCLRCSKRSSSFYALPKDVRAQRPARVASKLLSQLFRFYFCRQYN